MRDVPAIKWERRMPGRVDISPMILVSSFPDWEAFNQWWRDLARNRIEADGAIREKVRELIRGEDTPEDRARAIFHYVASEIRYVGLEYGKGGFRPHHAKEVFANKYGDCKDQAILLVAMLKEAGVSAYPTLIGTRSGGCGCGMWDLQRSIPMSQFNHCIAVARIGGRDIWLDPTDETCSSGFRGSPMKPITSRKKTGTIPSPGGIPITRRSGFRFGSPRGIGFAICPKALRPTCRLPPTNSSMQTAGE
jgi:transglutaminase-like putative cysteine protease